VRAYVQGFSAVGDFRPAQRRRLHHRDARRAVRRAGRRRSGDSPPGVQPRLRVGEGDVLTGVGRPYPPRRAADGRIRRSPAASRRTRQTALGRSRSRRSSSASQSATTADVRHHPRRRDPTHGCATACWQNSLATPNAISLSVLHRRSTQQSAETRQSRDSQLRVFGLRCDIGMSALSWLAASCTSVRYKWSAASGARLQSANVVRSLPNVAV